MGYNSKAGNKFTFKLIYIMFSSKLLVLMLISMPVSYAKSPSLNNQHIYKDEIFNPLIKSVRLYKKGFELSDAVIQLNSNEKIILSFDDLDFENVKNFRYSIQHCDPHWMPTDLLEPQYVKGYNMGYINDYEFSRNTLIPFIHYKLEFPNEDLMPIISGNYILKVFDENEDVLLFTRRFGIVEPLVNINAEVVPVSGVEGRKSKQEVNFKVLLNNLNIQNPENDLYVTVKQNFRTDNSVEDVKPMRNLGSVLDYSYNEKTIFEGGNEYRNFDTKSLKYNTEFVKDIRINNDTMDVFLWKNESRAFEGYQYSRDINGRWIVQLDEEYESQTNADYCWVNIELDVKGYYSDAEIFVFGGLSNWKRNDKYKMKYDFESKTYKSRLFLKQGYYNYLFVYVDKTTPNLNTIKFEGSYFETKNEYLINVYYNKPGTYYYRLIGYYIIDSQ